VYLPGGRRSGRHALPYRPSLELVRYRRGESAEFAVEACDAQGRLALHAELGHGLLIHVYADRRRDVFTPRSESLARGLAFRARSAPSYVRVGKKQVGNCRHCGSCNQQAA
jgi:hypothetical protein